MKESEPPAVTSHVIKICQNKQTHVRRNQIFLIRTSILLSTYLVREGQKKTKKTKNKKNTSILLLTWGKDRRRQKKETKKAKERVREKQEMRNERGG